MTGKDSKTEQTVSLSESADQITDIPFTDADFVTDADLEELARLDEEVSGQRQCTVSGSDIWDDNGQFSGGEWQEDRMFYRLLLQLPNSLHAEEMGWKFLHPFCFLYNRKTILIGLLKTLNKKDVLLKDAQLEQILDDDYEQLFHAAERLIVQHNYSIKDDRLISLMILAATSSIGEAAEQSQEQFDNYAAQFMKLFLMEGHMAKGLAAFELWSKIFGSFHIPARKKLLKLYEHAKTNVQQPLLAVDKETGFWLTKTKTPPDTLRRREDKKFLEKAYLPKELSPTPEISNLCDQLRDEFPWFEDVTDHIERELKLASYLGRKHFELQPILLNGAAGAGKTRYCKRLAAIVGSAFGVISGNGSNDNMSLRGASAGWGTAMVGRPLETIMKSGIANPIFLVDEIEKGAPSRHNGNIQDTLLGLLEKGTARVWFDECLKDEVDLSHISWIFTSNSQNGIQRPLLDRLKVFKVQSPAPADLPTIIQGIQADIGREFDVDHRLLPKIGEFDLKRIEDAFKKDGSIRAVQALVRQSLLQSFENQTYERMR